MAITDQIGVPAIPGAATDQVTGRGYILQTDAASHIGLVSGGNIELVTASSSVSTFTDQITRMYPNMTITDQITGNPITPGTTPSGLYLGALAADPAGTYADGTFYYSTVTLTFHIRSGGVWIDTNYLSWG